MLSWRLKRWILISVFLLNYCDILCQLGTFLNGYFIIIILELIRSSLFQFPKDKITLTEINFVVQYINEITLFLWYYINFKKTLTVRDQYESCRMFEDYYLNDLNKTIDFQFYPWVVPIKSSPNYHLRSTISRPVERTTCQV